MVGPQVVQDGPRGSGLGVCCNATTLYSICTVYKYCNISLRDESFLGCICMLVIMVLLGETNIFGGRTQFKKLKKLWIRATKLFDVTLKKLGFFYMNCFVKHLFLLERDAVKLFHVQYVIILISRVRKMQLLLIQTGPGLENGFFIKAINLCTLQNDVIKLDHYQNIKSPWPSQSADTLSQLKAKSRSTNLKIYGPYIPVVINILITSGDLTFWTHLIQRFFCMQSRNVSTVVPVLMRDRPLTSDLWPQQIVNI